MVHGSFSQIWFGAPTALNLRMPHLVTLHALVHPFTSADVVETTEILITGVHNVFRMAYAAPFGIIGGFHFHARYGAAEMSLVEITSRKIFGLVRRGACVLTFVD